MYFICRPISFDNFESQLPSENLTVPPVREPLNAPKSREQRIQEALSILRDGRLSPFDIVLDLLDDSKLRYWGYRNEFFKQENENLPKILEAIYSNKEGKERMDRWMLPHALEIICAKVSDEMDEVQMFEKLPGLHAITPEFIKTWTVTGHKDKAPYLFQILLAAAETVLAKEKNKKKSPLAVR